MIALFRANDYYRPYTMYYRNEDESKKIILDEILHINIYNENGILYRTNSGWFENRRWNDIILNESIVLNADKPCRLAKDKEPDFKNENVVYYRKGGDSLIDKNTHDIFFHINALPKLKLKSKEKHIKIWEDEFRIVYRDIDTYTIEVLKEDDSTENRTICFNFNAEVEEKEMDKKLNEFSKKYNMEYSKVFEIYAKVKRDKDLYKDILEII